MDDEHAGVGRGLIDHILEEDGALLGGGHGTQGELDGVDVVVDGLGKTDDGEIVAARRAKKRIWRFFLGFRVDGD